MVARSRELGPGLRGLRVIEAWPEVVGPAVAEHAWAVDFWGDTLLVFTDSPVWAHQLQMLELDLLAKLRARVDEASTLRRLRFRSSTRRDRAADGPAEPRPVAPGPPVRPELDEAGRRMIAAAAALVPDPELAQALERALRAQVGPVDPPNEEVKPA